MANNNKILIVGCEEDYIKLIDILLKKKGFKTELINNKQQFKNQIKELNPDIIILSDLVPNAVEYYYELFPRFDSIPKSILITDERYNKGELEILQKELNIIDYINPNLINDLLLEKISKNISN